MYLLGDPEGGAVLAAVTEPSGSLFCLSEDVVFALVEVALEEEMGFLLFASLAHQLQDS